MYYDERAVPRFVEAEAVRPRVPEDNPEATVERKLFDNVLAAKIPGEKVGDFVMLSDRKNVEADNLDRIQRRFVMERFDALVEIELHLCARLRRNQSGR